MTGKEKLLEIVKGLPDDLQVFVTEKDKHDVIDIKVFTVPKSDTFIKHYFAP